MMKLSKNHPVRILKSKSSNFVRLSLLLPLIDIILSSMKLPNNIYCMIKTRSSIKILNSKGPSTDLRGTPVITFSVVLALLLLQPCVYDFLEN